MALTASAFWMGAVGAFSWGYFGPYELGRMALHWKLLIVAGMTIPPLLMWLAALIVRRAEALRITTEDLSLIAWRLTQPEDSAAREITRVGRAVRREIDALNTGLENALSRVRALEETMTERTAEIERTTAEVAERVDHVRYRLRDERERLSELSLSLRGEAERIGEVLSGRVALVRTAAEGAAEELREAQKVIDNQIESFKTAAAAAAEGSKLAGKEIEREAARFEATAESASPAPSRCNSATSASAARCRTPSSACARKAKRSRARSNASATISTASPTPWRRRRSASTPPHPMADAASTRSPRTSSPAWSRWDRRSPARRTAPRPRAN